MIRVSLLVIVHVNNVYGMKRKKMKEGREKNVELFAAAAFELLWGERFCVCIIRVISLRDVW